jgi:hypothetical protein
MRLLRNRERESGKLELSRPPDVTRQMAFAFDSLGYAKKLRDAGVPLAEAEAHAEAAREFIMTELVTHSDLDVLRRELDAKFENVALRIDALSLRLTVRMGVMLAAGLSILAAIQRLH